MDGLDPFERNIHEYVWVGGAPPFCMFMCCELVRKWVLVSHLGKRFNNFKCLYDPQDSIQNWYQTTALYTVMEFELMDIYQI